MTDGVLGDFDNLLARPPGRWLRLAGRLLPGVRAVARQREPYAAHWAAANRAALDAPDGGPLWVALGDSMSQGIGASAPDRGWVGQAHAALPHLRVLNLSQSGGVVADVLEHQLPVLERLPEPPAVVTVLVGANDVFNPSRRAALPDAFARLLDRLPPGAVVARMPQPMRAAQAVNRLIDDDVRGRGVVPVSVEVDWSGRLAADRFHPNDDGYAAIAEAFVAAMRRASSSRRTPVRPSGR